MGGLWVVVYADGLGLAVGCLCYCARISRVLQVNIQNSEHPFSVAD